MATCVVPVRGGNAGFFQHTRGRGVLRVCVCVRTNYFYIDAQGTCAAKSQPKRRTRV